MGGGRGRETARPENNVSFPIWLNNWVPALSQCSPSPFPYFPVLPSALSNLPPSSPASLGPPRCHANPLAALLRNLARRTLTLMHLLLMRFRRVFRLMVTYLSLTTQHRLPRRCSAAPVVRLSTCLFRLHPIPRTARYARREN